MRTNARRSTFATTVLLATIVTGAATSAQADAQYGEKAGMGDGVAAKVFTSAEPESTYRNLSKKELRAFNVEMLLAEEEEKLSGQGLGSNAEKTLASHEVQAFVDGSSALAAKRFAGCWALAYERSGKNGIGKKLYTYGQTTRVCVEKGKVKSVKVTDAWNETQTPGWRVVKDPTRKTKNAGWEGRGRSQHFFELSIWGHALQSPTPCAQLRLNSDGHNRLASGSCNLN